MFLISLLCKNILKLSNLLYIDTCLPFKGALTCPFTGALTCPFTGTSCI